MQEIASTRNSVSYHLKDLLKRPPETVRDIANWLETRAEKPRDKARRAGSKRMSARLIAAQFILKAAEADVPAIKELMDRTEGKVADRLIGELSKTVNIRIELAGRPQDVVVEGETVTRQLMSPDVTSVDSDTSK